MFQYTMVLQHSEGLGVREPAKMPCFNTLRQSKGYIYSTQGLNARPPTCPRDVSLASCLHTAPSRDHLPDLLPARGTSIQSPANIQHLGTTCSTSRLSDGRQSSLLPTYSTQELSARPPACLRDVNQASCQHTAPSRVSGHIPPGHSPP